MSPVVDVSFSELEKYVKALDLPFNEAQIATILTDFDTDGDQRIGYACYVFALLSISYVECADSWSFLLSSKSSAAAAAGQ